MKIDPERKPYLALACWLAQKGISTQDMLVRFDWPAITGDNALKGQPFTASQVQLSRLLKGTNASSGEIALECGVGFDHSTNKRRFAAVIADEEILDAYLIKHRSTLRSFEKHSQPINREQPLAAGIRFATSEKTFPGRSTARHELAITFYDLRHDAKEKKPIWQLKKLFNTASEATECQNRVERICSHNKDCESAHLLKMMIERAWMNQSLGRH